MYTVGPRLEGTGLQGLGRPAEGLGFMGLKHYDLYGLDNKMGGGACASGLGFRAYGC